MLTTVNVSGRKLAAVSRAELERRWQAVRAHMNEYGIDALILQNSRDFLGGYVKWFTDVPAGLPRTVIFHANDLMTIVDHGQHGRERKLDGHDLDHPGVGSLVSTWAFPNVVYTEALESEAVNRILLSRGYQCIATVGEGAMPFSFVSGLRQALDGKIEITTATEFIDQLKAIKSEEELANIRQVALMQDEVLKRVLGRIEPGMLDHEINAIASFEGQMLGSEQAILIGASAPLGKCAYFAGRHFQGRAMGKGDHMCLMLENNGAGGYYTHLGRIIVFGKASAALLDAVDLMIEAQTETAKRLKIGASASDLAAAHDTFMTTHGLPADRRLYAHGQGFDLVERPLIRADETMHLGPGMNIGIHPGYADQTVFAHVCDNFILNHDGSGEFIHHTPKQVFEL